MIAATALLAAASAYTLKLANPINGLKDSIFANTFTVHFQEEGDDSWKAVPVSENLEFEM